MFNSWPLRSVRILKELGPLVGANEILWLCNHMSFNVSTQYAYHLIALVMMSNFGPRTLLSIKSLIKY